MPSVGRKFLLAGRGGLNLTHSEELALSGALWRGRAAAFAAAIEAFPPEALRAWCEALGQPTFVGSSGRVFPKSMKASPLLRAWLGAARCGRRRDSSRATLARLGRRTAACCSRRRTARRPSPPTRPCWRSAARAGRGSAPTATGSPLLARAGVAVAPLQPANCGFVVAWSEMFRNRFEGQPLKRVALTFGDRTRARRGHGHAQPASRAAPSTRCRPRCARPSPATGAAMLHIDLRPDLALADLRSASRRAARQAVAVDVPAQGREPVAGRDRPAARGGMAHAALADMRRRRWRRWSRPCRCA